MAVFKCKMCGGDLNFDENSTIVVCKYCGTKQTLPSDGGDQEAARSAAALLDRGYITLEDGEWAKAEEIFDQVLNLSPRCGDAYLGAAMARLRLTSRSVFREKYLSGVLDADKGVARAKQFASGQLKTLFDNMDSLRQTTLEERERQAARAGELFARQRVDLGSRRDVPLPKQLISASAYHTVALKSDGTPLGTPAVFPDCNGGPEELSRWTGIVAVAAGAGYTIGLRRDGTVVSTAFVGDPEYNFGQCQVSSWRNIAAVACGFWHTVGLREEGTVVAVGDNRYGQCQVDSWTGIIDIDANERYTVGLRADGTVAITGQAGPVIPAVESWRNIVGIAVGQEHILGLQAGGTVVAAGTNDGRCRVEQWTNVVALAAGNLHSIGLRADGTVLAAMGSCPDEARKVFNISGQDNVGGWRDIVAVSAGCEHTVGLRRDGVVLSTGYDAFGACRVSGWRLFESVDTLAREFAQNAARGSAGPQPHFRYEDALTAQYAALQKEYNACTGLFNGKRRRQLAVEMVKIEIELNRLNGH